MEYFFVTKKPNSHAVVHGNCEGAVFPGAVMAEILELPKNGALAIPRTLNPDHYYVITGFYPSPHQPPANHEMWTEGTFNHLNQCVPGPWYHSQYTFDGYTFSVVRRDIPGQSYSNGVIFTDGARWCHIPDEGEPVLGIVNDWAPLALKKLADLVPEVLKDWSTMGRLIVGFSARGPIQPVRTFELEGAPPDVVWPRIGTESLPVYRNLAVLYRADLMHYHVSGVNSYLCRRWVNCSEAPWLADKRIRVQRIPPTHYQPNAPASDTTQEKPQTSKKAPEKYLFRAETKGLYIFDRSVAADTNWVVPAGTKYTVYVDCDIPRGEAILQEMRPDFISGLFRIVDAHRERMVDSQHVQIFEYANIFFRYIFREHEDDFQRLDTMLRSEVKRLGDEHGYGRLMQLAQENWRIMLSEKGMEGGEFAYGPCVSQVVPCPHPVKDKNGNCPVCAGSGHITKWVHNHLVAIGVIPQVVEEQAAPTEEGDIPGETSPLVDAGIALSDIREWIETRGTIEGVHMDDRSVIEYITLILDRIGEAS